MSQPADDTGGRLQEIQDPPMMVLMVMMVAMMMMMIPTAFNACLRFTANTRIKHRLTGYLKYTRSGESAITFPL